MPSAPVPDPLAELGVRPELLNGAQRDQLDRDGFCILPGLIDATWREALRARVDDLVVREGADDVTRANYATEFHREPGSLRLGDLVNKGEVFDRTWHHPQVLAAVHHILGRPFKLSSLNFREGLRGHGHQDLHADWGRNDGTFHVVNSLWLIDPLTLGNGPTRIVPGTQRTDLSALPADRRAQPHPDEVIIQAPAGSVVVFNAHAWHGGTLNRSGERRRMLHVYYTAREHPQQLVQADFLRVKTAARLTPAARWLLDA